MGLNPVADHERDASDFCPAGPFVTFAEHGSACSMHLDAAVGGHEAGSESIFAQTIDKAGIGRFHRWLLIVCGAANAADAVEIVAVSFILSPASDELELSGVEQVSVAWLHCFEVCSHCLLCPFVSLLGTCADTSTGSESASGLADRHDFRGHDAR